MSTTYAPSGRGPAACIAYGVDDDLDHDIARQIERAINDANEDPFADDDCVPLIDDFDDSIDNDGDAK
jgi:hypothetical protein